MAGVTGSSPVATTIQSFPTPRAFAVSALAYAVATTGVIAADVLFNIPEVLHMPTMMVAMFLFGLTAIALHVNPDGAASKRAPRGRALAIFFVLHIGGALQAICFPLGRGAGDPGADYLFAVIGAAGSLMLFAGAIGSLMSAFRHETVKEESRASE